MTAPLELLRTAYDDLVEILDELAAGNGAWAPTGCRGWAVHDLAFHLLGDTRRALVALNSPASRPADRDAVTYWSGWRAPEPRDDEALRRTRVVASTAMAFDDLVEVYRECTSAVLVAATRAPAAQPVRTQGWVVEVDDLLSTLVVEAAVHHLDLVAHLDRPGPADGPLAEVRRVLEGLLGGPLPSGWDDATAARRGTGREPLTGADRAELGARAGAFPLFG